MSSKSAVKLVVPEDSESALYKWVAILTGSKNALKGVGFFLGGLLLTVTSFQTAMLILAAMVATALIVTVAAHARRPREDRRQGQVPPHVLPEPGDQHPRGGARLPVRLPRRLVRRRPARLPAQRPRLELLGGRHLPGRLGDRLRDRPGVGAAARSSARSRASGASPTARPRPGSPSSSPRSLPASRSRSRRTSTPAP